MAERTQSSAQNAYATDLGTFTSLRSNLLDLSIGSFFLNVLGLALPLSLLQVYDRIVPNESTSTLLFLLLGVFSALVLEGILRTCRGFVTGWIGARFEYLAGTAALERLLTTSVEDFEKDGSGMHMEHMAGLSTVKDFYSGQAILAVLDLPFVVVYLGLIGFLGGLLVLIPLALLLLFALSAYLLGIKLRGSLGDRMVSDERRFSFIIEVLNGIHTVKSMAMEAQMLRRYERLQESCAQGDYSVAQRASAAMSLSSFFSQLTMVSVVTAGSTYVIDQQMTIGGLAACTMLSARSMSPLTRAMGIWSRFQTIRLARERLRKIFALPPEALSGLPTTSQIVGKVEMRDVNFRYIKDGAFILENINVSIAPGECIGIAGGNGSGKSTLLGLMLGILKPS
ncbi:MAG: ABC transporter permease, partial [Alphaproteobacteria bacterium RIFOXYD12_FULL_60_8]